MTQVPAQFLNAEASSSFRDGIQYAWSASTIKLAETCLRKYQYEMLEGWHGRGKNVHLRFGGHYATALEHFHKRRAEGQSYDEAMRTVVLEALTDTWDYDECDICKGSGLVGDGIAEHQFVCVGCSGTGNLPSGQPWVSDHNFKTRETLIRTIVWYLEHFRDEPALPIILEDGAPAVELSVLLPVDNGVVFSAHLDRLADYADNTYVVDQKTTGSTLSANYFNQYSPDSQMSMYTFLGKAAFGLPVKGVLIDAAQIAVGFTRFERGVTMRTEGQLNEWYDHTLTLIERARRATAERNLPMNPSACGNFGGCAFRAVCSRDPAARLQFLKADFIQGGVYDPLEKR